MTSAILCTVCREPFESARPMWDDECPKCEARRVRKCVECGKGDRAKYFSECRERMLAANLCFNCLFWTDRLAEKDYPETVRVAGDHYQIGPADDSPMRGYGGRPFRIQFGDGRTVDTRNLWHQGTIPAHFAARMPDNAEFIPVSVHKSITEILAGGGIGG